MLVKRFPFFPIIKKKICNMAKIFRNEFPFFISKDIKIRNRSLAWGIEYTVAQCTDTPNFIFAIKQ